MDSLLKQRRDDISQQKYSSQAVDRPSQRSKSAFGVRAPFSHTPNRYIHQNPANEPLKHLLMNAKLSAQASATKAFDTTSTQSKAVASVALKQKEQLKQRLQPEWRNLYRALVAGDGMGTGAVSKLEFERVAHSIGVYLGRDDVQRILKYYGSGGSIQYGQMGEDLGM